MSTEQPAGELTLIIERYLALRDQGLETSIDQLCRNAPHLVEAVTKELVALGEMDRVLGSAADGAAATGQVSQLGHRQGQAAASVSYQIDRLHGHGGCSEVYIAYDERLNRQVAIKFLRPDTEHLPAYRIRLKREAEITSQLNHPGVVSIHSMGEDHRGLPFYTMRYVEGDSMARAVEQFHGQQQGRRDMFYSVAARKLLDHFKDICQTIAFAHSKGVIHRDLKPANFVLGSFGETYVIDWGLARYLNGSDPEPCGDEVASQESFEDTSESPRLTQLGSAIGSPAYMSPEQASGTDAGVPSDIFNLGATLYTILTGRPPYEDESLLRILNDAEHARYRGPRDQNPAVPRALNAVCRKAMSRTARDRYQSADELANEIDRFLANEPVLAMREPWTDRMIRRIRKHKTLVTALATSAMVAILLLTVGNAMLLERNRELARREAIAVKLKEETREALGVATESLYSQRIALAYGEYLKNNPRRALEILNECPVPYRQWEWHHLYWLMTRHMPWRSIAGSGQLIRGLAVHPHEQQVAFGDSRGVVHLWDPESDTVQQRLATNVGARDIQFSPDGNRLVVAGTVLDGTESRATIQLWDLTTGSLIVSRSSNSIAFTSVDYSDDGKRIATGSVSGGIRIRNALDLVPIHRVNGAHDGEIGNVQFLDNSYELLTGGKQDGFIRLWDEDGKNAANAHLHAGGLSDFCFSGKRFCSAGNDKLVKIWEGAEDQPFGFNPRSPEILVGHSDKIEAIGVSPDGRYLASAGLDRNVRIWDLETGEETSVVRQHSSHVRHVQFDVSGELLFTGGDDNRANGWRVERLTHALPRGMHVTFAADQQTLVAAAESSIEVWNAATLKPLMRITEHPARLIKVVPSPVDRRLAGLYANGLTRIWDSVSGKSIQDLQQTRRPVIAGLFSHDGKQLITSDNGGTLSIRDSATGTLLHTVESRISAFRLALTSDGRHLLTGHHNGMVSIRSTSDLSLIAETQAHDGALLDIAVHPDRLEVATAAKSGEVRIWQLVDGELRMIREMEIGASWLNCMVYSPDGRRIVSGSEHTITFWDSANGAEVLSLSVNRCVHSMAFSADGRFLAVTGEDPRVRVWQAADYPGN